jgi:hypothetical protein
MFSIGRERQTRLHGGGGSIAMLRRLLRGKKGVPSLVVVHGVPCADRRRGVWSGEGRESLAPCMETEAVAPARGATRGYGAGSSARLRCCSTIATACGKPKKWEES